MATQQAIRVVIIVPTFDVYFEPSILCIINITCIIYTHSLTMSCIHTKQVHTDDVITFKQSDLCTALNRSSVFG